MAQGSHVCLATGDMPVAAPNEMAGTVLYLVSDASSYTTGVALNVDGGFLA